MKRNIEDRIRILLKQGKQIDLKTDDRFVPEQGVWIGCISCGKQYLSDERFTPILGEEFYKGNKQHPVYRVPQQVVLDIVTKFPEVTLSV